MLFLCKNQQASSKTLCTLSVMPVKDVWGEQVVAINDETCCWWALNCEIIAFDCTE